MKTYPSTRNAHTGTSGFTNYMDSPEMDDIVAEIKDDGLEDVVVIDGDDNWHADDRDRPQSFVPKHMRRAYVHTGISGIAKSGMVVSRYRYPELKKRYKDKYGIDIEENENLTIRVIR